MLLFLCMLAFAWSLAGLHRIAAGYWSKPTLWNIGLQMTVLLIYCIADAFGGDA